MVVLLTRARYAAGYGVPRPQPTVSGRSLGSRWTSATSALHAVAYDPVMQRVTYTWSPARSCWLSTAAPTAATTPAPSSPGVNQGLGRTPKTGSRPGPRPDPHSAPQLERGTSSARAGGQWTWCHGGGVWAPSRPPKRSRWRFSVTNGTLNFRISTVKSHVDSRRSGAMMVADEGRDSALIRAWFNLRHKLATAPSRHH